jgi:hypothetical protein
LNSKTPSAKLDFGVSPCQIYSIAIAHQIALKTISRMLYPAFALPGTEQFFNCVKKCYPRINFGVVCVAH